MYTHMYTNTYVCARVECVCNDIEWRRPIGCLIFMGHFPQKSPIKSVSFAKKDPQLKAFYASSPLCPSACISGGCVYVGIHTYNSIYMYVCVCVCVCVHEHT